MMESASATNLSQLASLDSLEGSISENGYTSGYISSQQNGIYKMSSEYYQSFEG